MSPSKKPNLIVALGIGKPKRESAPPGMPEMPGREPHRGVEPDAPEEQAEGEGAVKPEAVSYRTSDQVCSACEYMDDAGSCKWLKMPVGEGDSCNLFEAAGGPGEMGGSEGMPPMEPGA